jgi:hypothetical protein
MKVTVILKDLSDAFYNGSEFLGPGLLQLPTDADRWARLRDVCTRGELKATMKVGSSDSFRDKVELNQILRGPVSIAFKLESRKGYKLAMFEIVPLSSVKP